MDNHQRSGHYLFWRRVVLCLTVFSLLYIGVIRQIEFLHIIFPGHISLALALFWTAKSRKMIRILLLYQLVLIFVMPVAGLLILEGHR